MTALWLSNVERKKKDLGNDRTRFPDDAELDCCFTLATTPPCTRPTMARRAYPFRYFRRYPSEPVTETPNARSGDAPPTSDAIRLSQTACAELCP